MNAIISRIHSGDLVCVMVAASPNIISMYFMSASRRENRLSGSHR